MAEEFFQDNFGNHRKNILAQIRIWYKFDEILTLRIFLECFAKISQISELIL